MPGAADRPTDNTPYVFVSYASADRERVTPVVDILRRAGVTVWLDQQGITGGENYGREITGAIKGCAALVLIASTASLASRNVVQEVALGWRFERPYLPLLLEAVTIPDDLAYWLEAAQWIEVLNRPEGEWLPQVLAALAPLGIVPVVPQHEAVNLAGREKELGVLREKLAVAKEGKGGLVLIGGEAGIGKTTIAEAVLREAARDGVVVLEGHCFDLAETPPYGPWVDLFLHLPATRAMPPLPEAFALRGTVGAVPSQMALFAQVEDFLRALASSRPVVLLLDDLHWADPASLDLLRFLARSVSSLPLLLLVTYRSDELTRKHPLYQLLPQLAREAGAERIDLGRLDDDAVRHLVAERYGLPDGDAARLVAYLQGRAEGNALFVGELLRSLEEANALRRAQSGDWLLGDLTATAMPALLRQVIDGRLARLDEDAQRLLAIAAVVGHEVSLAVWTAVAEVSEDAVLAAVEQSLDAQLLTETGGEAVRFAHALVREALYEGMPSIRSRRLHRRVGEALAEARSPDPDRVAYHFQRAGDDRALPWLLAAGERAQAAYAWTTAAARFEAALALMERTDADERARGWLLLRSSRLLRYVDRPKARAFAEEAVALAQAVDAGALAAYARFQCGLLGCMVGDIVHGLPDMEAGVAAIAALTAAEWEDSAAHADAIHIAADRRATVGTVVMWLADVGQYREARERGAPLLAEAEQGDAEGLHWFRDGYVGLGDAAAALGMPDEAAAMLATAHAHYLRVGHHVLASFTSTLMALVMALPYRAEDIAGRRALMDRAEWEMNLASDAISTGMPLPFFHLPRLLLEGEWEEAEQIAAAWSAEERGTGPYWRMALMHLAVLSRLRGRPERAWSAVRRCLPLGSGTTPGTVRSFTIAATVQQVATALALDAGDLVGAREWAAANDRWLEWSGAVRGQSEGQALWARYHRQAGDIRQAYEHAERALAHASEPRQPLALIAAHRLLGELDTESARYDEALGHLGTSLDLADACAAPYERALSLLAMAELRAAKGDAADARRLLNEVESICQPLGAKPTLVRAHALAARLAIG